MNVGEATRLRRVIVRLARQFNAAATDEGLTPSQASVLGVVSSRGPFSLSELARIENLNPTMLSRVIGMLNETGLVERVSDPDDLRSAKVVITAAGHRVHQRIIKQRSALVASSIAQLPAEQARQIILALPALEALAEELLKERSTP